MAFPSEGYLYAVCGPDRFYEEAVRSARSLRRVDPAAHITLVCDREPAGSGWAGAFDHVAVRSLGSGEGAWERGLLYKVQHAYHDAPYERTVFIDSDTYFLESPRPLFAMLAHLDLCLAHGTSDTSEVVVGDAVLEAYTPYNTGFMAFRKGTAMADLFVRWEAAYRHRFDVYPHDQPALMEALLEVPVRYYILPNVWNCRFIYPEKLKGRVRMLHGRHPDYEHLARRINATEEPRVWMPQVERCLSVIPSARERWTWAEDLLAPFSLIEVVRFALRRVRNALVRRLPPASHRGGGT